MIVGNQVVAQWREVETQSEGQVSRTWTRIKSGIHVHIKTMRPDEKSVSKRKDFFVDAVMTCSYPSWVYRDVVVIRGRGYRVEVINLVEGPQKTYHIEMRRDEQPEKEIAEL